jgi:hypothetical protein
MANTATPASYTTLLNQLDRLESTGRDMSGTRAQIRRSQDAGAFTEELVTAMIGIVDELGEL